MPDKPRSPQPESIQSAAKRMRSAPRAAPGRSLPAVYQGGGQVAKRRRDPMPALSFLQGSDLWSTWQRLSALEKDLQQIQPRLALKPLKLANQILVVTAGSPAVAARLRQFEPSLIEGLRARGWLVGRIRFRPIAAHDIPPLPTPREKEPVSPKVLSELQAFEEDEMNPELKAALHSFVRRQKSYLGS
jgi:hypothetical protein